MLASSIQLEAAKDIKVVQMSPCNKGKLFLNMLFSFVDLAESGYFPFFWEDKLKSFPEAVKGLRGPFQEFREQA